MIGRIRHKGLARFYETGDLRGIDAKRADWLHVLLTTMDQATVVEDLRLPGFRLHQLKGNFKGCWAVSVSGNWRLVFRFEDGHVTDVDMLDYH